jgi:uncharacterized protein YggE
MSKKRQVTAAFVLGGLLALGALAALGTGVAQQPGDAGDETGDEFVRVTASGAAEAEADAAEVTLAVEARDDDPSAARQQVANGVQSTRAALASVGVSDDDIHTTGYTLRESGRFEREGDVPRHYARHTLRVELNGTDRVGEVIDAAVGGGATTVSGVSFTVSDEKRSELKNEALETAMDNARSQAEAVAGAGGVSVTSVRSVSTGDTGFSPVSVGRGAFDAAESAGTEVDPGPVGVDATVEVVYEISS